MGDQIVPTSTSNKITKESLQLNHSVGDLNKDATISPTDSTVTSFAETFKSLESMATSDGGTFRSVPSTMHSTDVSYKSAESMFASATDIQIDEDMSINPGSKGKTDGDEAGDGSHKTNKHTSKHSTNSDSHNGESSISVIQAQPAAFPIYGFCPPGLENLLDTGQLIIHKENLRHNQVFSDNAASRLEVIDETRRLMFYVERESQDTSESASSSETSFLFKLYNKDKQESIHVYSPDSRTCLCRGATWHWFKRCHFQAMVFAPIGQVAGFIRRSHTYFVQEYEILNAQEELVLLLRGGPLDLEIYTPDMENELGRLSVHGWHGIMHEVRRSRNDYGLTFPLDLDLRIKAVLLGAVFAIDWIFSSDNARK